MSADFQSRVERLVEKAEQSGSDGHQWLEVEAQGLKLLELKAFTYNQRDSIEAIVATASEHVDVAWRELDQLACDHPQVVIPSQWQQLYDFAEAGLESNESTIDWSGKIAEYKGLQERVRWQIKHSIKEQKKQQTPTRRRKLVTQEIRESLMQSFKIEQMDGKTANLVDFLIQRIPLEKFQPLGYMLTDSSFFGDQKISEFVLPDLMYIENLKRLLENEGMGLMEAYKYHDEMYGLSPRTTQNRISAMKKLKAEAVEFGKLDGRTIVKKQKTKKPRYPELIEIIDNYHRKKKGREI
jgi:hypothetical protein